MGTSATRTRTGTMAVSALAAAAIATAGLGSAPTASATCASFFGIGGGANCTSKLTSIAIAIGPGAEAHAEGILGAALSLGANAAAITGGNNAFDFSVAAGANATAFGGGLFGIAAVLGRNTFAQTDGSGKLGDLGLNIALNITPFNKNSYQTVAAGIGNVALNLFGRNTGGAANVVFNGGIAGVAVNVGGKDNDVQVSGKFLDTAFNVFGRDNRTIVSPGPFALAGSIFQKNKLITKQKPGFNINGFRVPNTAAAVNPRSPKPSATTHRAARASADKRAAAMPAATQG